MEKQELQLLQKFHQQQHSLLAPKLTIDESTNVDNLYKRKMWLLDEDMSVKDDQGPDLSLHLGLLAPQMLTQNNLQYNDQRQTSQAHSLTMTMQP